MNFSTHALEEMKRWSKRFADLDRTPDALAVEVYSKALKNSVKFLLPPNGEVGVELKDSTCFKFVKLPYPVVAFEYTMKNDKLLLPSQTPCSQRIAIAMTPEYYCASLKSLVYGLVDGKDDTFKRGDIIIITLVYDEVSKIWVPSFTGLILDVNTAVVASDLGKYSVGVVPLCTQSIDAMATKVGVSFDKMVSDIAADMTDEVRVVINALACLNAKNVKQVSVPAPEKLNAKRIRNGKTPFFEYRVLDIFLGDAVRKLPSGDGKRLRASLSCLLAVSVRLHAVRGHFKRRHTGLFWWNHFIRGNSESGSIVKDYNLKTDAPAE